MNRVRIRETLFPWLAQRPSIPRYNFKGIDEYAVCEFHRQAELCLEGTLKLALAADSRATATTNIFSAAAAGAFVVSANLAGGERPHYALISAIVAAGITLLLAAVYCGFSSRPIDFFVAGYEPDYLFESSDTELHIKTVSAEDIQYRIDSNRFAMRIAANTLRMGQALAICSPIVFIIVYCLFSR